MKRRLHEYTQWLRLNENKGELVTLRATLDLRSEFHTIDDLYVYYIVAKSPEKALEIYLQEVKTLLENTEEENPNSISSRLNLTKYRTPESMELLGVNLEDLSEPSTGKREDPMDFFNPDEYESIRTKAKLYTDLTSLLSELNRDLVVESQSRRMEGPTFLGEGSHIVEVLVDLAEIDHKVISRYWSTKRRNFISPIYSEFLIQCEERGIPTGEPRIKNYRVISRIYGNPVLSKIASQLARLLGEGVDGMSPMTLRQLVEDLIGNKPVLKYSTPSTEQILALLDLAKDDLTPEEYRGYTMLLKVKDKVI